MNSIGITALFICAHLFKGLKLIGIQVWCLRFEYVAVNSQYEFQRAVSASEASHHWAKTNKQTYKPSEREQKY